MTKVYWIRAVSGVRHAVWSHEDTGKSVCGRAKKRGRSWEGVSKKPSFPTCKSCQARIRDRVKN